MKVSIKGKPIVDRLVYSTAAKEIADVVRELEKIEELETFDPAGAVGSMIQSLRAVCSIRAVAYWDEYSSKVRGRPKKIRPLQTTGIINRAIEEAKQVAPKPMGRPRKRPPGWDGVVYREVEKERNRLGQSSIKDAIESLLKTEIAPMLKMSEFRTIKENYCITRAAYNRGKRNSV
jgi:hypothetical protein